MSDPQPDFRPAPGVAEDIGHGVRRVLAPNPSPMTFRGTNSYLVGTREVAVIDPGPADAPHLEALLAAVPEGGRITHILVTHAHLDHSPLAARLSEATGARVHAFGPADAGRSDVMQRLAAEGMVGGGEGVDAGFVPDEVMADGAVLSGSDWQMTALHTPGHMANHLSFALSRAGTDEILFSGDLVMGWATSLVSPPDGDLGAFMQSLERLQTRAWLRFLPGHGAPVEDPAARLRELISHRKAREAAILSELATGPATAAALAGRIYTETPPALLPAATRNVLAHLIDLTTKNMVRATPDLAAGAVFSLS